VIETNRKHESDEALLLRRAAEAKPPFGDLSSYVRMLPAPPQRVHCGDLEVDRVERRAMLAGSDLRLTKREFKLLLCLVDRVNRAVRRSDLLDEIWTLPDDYGSNVVDVYVRRLRRKLGEHASMIRTIRGFGYCLRVTQAA
jgi:DNA-binding response OmpR family regulator